jgi:Asp-tRNA(Asn)/Glu-tRNA(Gln) amidotransferase A subunit family amidase
MEPTELCYLPATDLATLIRTRKVSPTEVADAFLTRIERVNPTINAYCTVTADRALAEAREVEAALGRGESVGPLAGVPMSIKDLLLTKGIRTTRGSLLYADNVPTEDAPVVERLRQAGAILLGKTNTPEFGWKAATDNQIFGPTRNPWNLDRTPGGSSGGAGAAVAAGLGPLAIGTDGGGSIRIPACFCGIFGLKATFGLVPAYPASYAEALSHTGPMTRTVRDAALMLNVIAGHDPRDRNSYPIGSVDFLKDLGDGIAGTRVAWSPNLGNGLVDPETHQAAERAARRFEGLGCHLEQASPSVGDFASPWQLLFFGAITAGLSSQPTGWEEKIDPGLAGIVQRARSASAIDLAQAYQARARIYDATRRFFGEYDLLLTPSFPVPPWRVGQDFPDEVASQKVGLSDVAQLTQLFNLTGQPAATVPCGWTTDGLPLGLQIVGRRHEDALVLRAAAAFEAIAPWADHRPAVD